MADRTLYYKAKQLDKFGKCQCNLRILKKKHIFSPILSLLKWSLNNRVLLYSTRNYIHYPVINCNEKEYN